MRSNRTDHTNESWRICAKVIHELGEDLNYLLSVLQKYHHGLILVYMWGIRPDIYDTPAKIADSLTNSGLLYILFPLSLSGRGSAAGWAGFRSYYLPRTLSKWLIQPSNAMNLYPKEL